MGLHCVAVPFESLTAEEVYAVARTRQDVFVVEQQCPYPDLDGRDVEPDTRHVMLTEDGALVGYARVLDDAGATTGTGPAWRIGRVLLLPAARGRGLSDLVMRTALSVARGRIVVLDAQAPLAGWYAGFGFTTSGPEFLEDGIPHVPMSRPVSD